MFAHLEHFLQISFSRQGYGEAHLTRHFLVPSDERTGPHVGMRETALCEPSLLWPNGLLHVEFSLQHQA